MTRKEAKARLRFIAEWWSPDILRCYEPGCVAQVAMDRTYPGDVLGPMFNYLDFPIYRTWDRGDRRAALRAIDALPE